MSNYFILLIHINFRPEVNVTYVENNSNEFLGKVIAVHNFGAGDLLELGKNYKYMIRFYDLNKKSIDTQGKIIKLNKNYEQ